MAQFEMQEIVLTLEKRGKATSGGHAKNLVFFHILAMTIFERF